MRDMVVHNQTCEECDALEKEMVAVNGIIVCGACFSKLFARVGDDEQKRNHHRLVKKYRARIMVETDEA